MPEVPRTVTERRYCSNCGVMLAPNTRFCGSCGAAAGTAGAAPGPDAAGAINAAETVRYAGFWRRFAAALIDGIAISIVTQPINLIVGQGFSFDTTQNTAGEVEDFHFDVDWTQIAVGNLLTTAITIAYYVIALSRWGQTIGALALSIKVMHPDGTLLSPGRAAVRWFGALVSSIPLGLGYFWMLWDPRKQTWHDKMAGSIVVKVKRPGEP